MYLKSLVSLLMLVLCFGVVAADTLKGKITKIDEKSVTFVEGEKEAKSFDFAKDVKFYLDKKGAKEEIKDGVKSDAFAKVAKKGVNATLTTTTDGKVTEVIVTKKKKGT